MSASFAPQSCRSLLRMVCFVCLRFVPESPRWLISQNKHGEALKITEAMAKENKRELSKKCKVELLESLLDD